MKWREISFLKTLPSPEVRLMETKAQVLGKPSSLLVASNKHS